MRRPATVALAAVTALVAVGGLLLAAGCGGSDPKRATVATVAPPPTGPFAAKDDYVRAGDRICEDAQAEATDLSRRSEDLRIQSESLPEEAFLRRYAQLWSDRIGYLERLRVAFRALGPSPGNRRLGRDFLRALDERLALARRVQARAARGRRVSTELVSSYDRALVRGNAILRDYGFEVCGRTPIL